MTTGDAPPGVLKAVGDVALRPAKRAQRHPAGDATRSGQPAGWRGQPPIILAILGLASWAYGVSEFTRSGIGLYGLLASASIWFLLGFVLLVVGFVLELGRHEPRAWLLGLQLVGLIVAIQATVPILYRVPEYAWVYKHIGITEAFKTYGHVTDPTNIYQQWPALFAGLAAVSSLGHVSPVSFVAWAPLAFELADALLLVAIFRQLTDDRRVPYLAVFLFEALVSWIGQDYLSPQAFTYLLALAVTLIVLRWLRRPGSPAPPAGRLARWRAPLLVGMRPVAPTPAPARAVAIVVVAVIYFVIVAAHQLTPYAVLVEVGALTVLDLVRPRWLLGLLAVIAVAYLVPHYHLIASQYGGIFSGGNPITNASGVNGVSGATAQANNGRISQALAVFMWLSTVGVLWHRRKALGRVAIAGALAFSPFLVVFAQSYGGEAIYRVYLFSAPWCALLIAATLCELRPRARVAVRWSLIGALCLVVLFAGLQALYGAAEVNAFTPSELTASQWVYGHTPRGSLILMPDGNFPALQVADYNHYDVEAMPSDRLYGATWLNEANLPAVEAWIRRLGHRTAYVVLSRSMFVHAAYYGPPKGFDTFVRTIPVTPGSSVIYRNPDVTIYRLNLP